MTLEEFFKLCSNDLKVSVPVKNGEMYYGAVGDCPAHMLGYEVCKTRTFCDELMVYVKKPAASSLTWQQLADAIGSMPKWAREMPAPVYIDPCQKYHTDTSYGIAGIYTYFGKTPSEIQDDGTDFVTMAIDADVYD